MILGAKESRRILCILWVQRSTLNHLLDKEEARRRLERELLQQFFRSSSIGREAAAKLFIYYYLINSLHLGLH